jgi:uncharacterized protein (DUF58 family)
VRPRLTSLNASFATVRGWLLLLGLLTARVELFLVTAPLVVALVAARGTAGARRYSLVHEVSAQRVFEGDPVTVSVTIRARSRIPLLEILEPLPPLVHVPGHRNRWFATLAPGEEIRWTYEVRPVSRQRVRLGIVHARLWDRSGLRVREFQHRDPKTVAVYPRTVALRRLPGPRMTQPYVGNYVSPALGEGIEPGDIRPFVPGDRIRQVNWRATLRRCELYVTQRHRERNADVVLMLDTLAAAGPPGDTTLDAATRAAASLAAAYLARKDRVGLIEYGGLIRWVKPGSGRPHAVRLLDALLEADVLFTYVAKDLALVPPRVLPPQALVIAVSALLDRRFLSAATDLAARRFDLVILAVSPLPAARAAMRPSPALDVASRLWTLERRAELETLRRQGLTVVEWDPAQPLQGAVAAFGRRRPRMIIAG